MVHWHYYNQCPLISYDVHLVSQNVQNTKYQAPGSMCPRIVHGTDGTGSVSAIEENSGESFGKKFIPAQSVEN